MKPDRSNYETWVIDWIDGRLSREEARLLEEFLAENPDLNEELSAISLPVLTKPEGKFKGSGNLKRTVHELPLSQVEFLSAAFLEKDISDEQLKELNESISSDPEKHKIFETIQNTRLYPDMNIVFRNKKTLKRTSPFVRFVLSPLSLGSAAAASILIIISLTLSRKTIIREDQLFSGINVPPSSGEVAPFVVRTERYTQPAVASSYSENVFNTAKARFTADIENAEAEASVSGVPERAAYLPIPAVSVGFRKPLSNFSASGAIIAMNQPARPVAFEDDNRKLGEFLARNIREKVLNEENPGGEPLKSYEIAEAGIEGINKLLGWEMELVRNTDNEGEIKSVYFSSRLVRFNTPVKKGEPAL